MLNIEMNFQYSLSNAYLYEFPMQAVPVTNAKLQHAFHEIGEDAIDMAMRVFEHPLTAIDWLNRPNSEFGNKAPIEVLKTKSGEKKVIKTLTRIDGNVYN